MLIIKVEKGNIEKALKRTKMQKAKYVEQKFNNPE